MMTKKRKCFMLSWKTTESGFYFYSIFFQVKIEWHHALLRVAHDYREGVRCNDLSRPVAVQDQPILELAQVIDQLRAVLAAAHESFVEFFEALKSYRSGQFIHLGVVADPLQL